MTNKIRLVIATNHGARLQNIPNVAMQSCDTFKFSKALEPLPKLRAKR